MKSVAIVASCFLLALVGYSYVFKASDALLVEGEKRTYTLTLPKKQYLKSDSEPPVLFLLHGNPSTSWQMKLYTGMSSVARKNGFIVVYPDAISNKWPYSDESAIQKEVVFIETLIDQLYAEYAIDTNRVYMSGISGGGIFSFILADLIPDKIAALAIIAGNIPKIVEHPEQIASIPLVLMHGTSDFLYHGRDDLYSADETIEFWTDKNNCDTIPQMEQLEDETTSDFCSVQKLTYACTPGQEVVFYKIIEGGHHWPGANFNADHFTKLELGNFNQDLSASEVIWEFVSGYRK